MNIPNHLRDALERVLDYAMSDDEKSHYEYARHNGCGHIYEYMLALREWLVAPQAPPAAQASLNLKLDEVNMIAYASESEPVCSFHYDDSEDSDRIVERARLIVHQTNVYCELRQALQFAKAAIDEAAEIMHYEDGDPVTFLESREIELAFGALVSVTDPIKRALAKCGFPQNAVDEVSGSAYA